MLAVALQMQQQGSVVHESVTSRLAQTMADTSFLTPAFEMIPRLLLLLDDPEANSEFLAEIIRLDAGLTTDVMHVANSASYSGANRTETLDQAIMRIGLREVYRVIMQIIASPILSSVDQPSFAKLQLWRHSITVAVAAQIIARAKGEQEEIAFTAGLLHDVGKIAMGQALAQDYVWAIDQMKPDSGTLWAAERKHFNTDHAELGGKLLKRWNFPEQIISAVAFHHDPAHAPKQHARLTAIVYAANLLAYLIHAGYGTPDYVLHPDLHSLSLADLTLDELQSFEEQVAMLAETAQARVR